MDHVELTSGHVALIDPEDHDLVAGYSWSPLVSKSGAIYAHVVRVGCGHLYMHRVVTHAGPEVEIDHRSGDGLDNRKINLRESTHAQNIANSRKPRLARPSTSQYKGVHWNKARGHWVAQIHHLRRGRTLGRFESERDAAVAYDRAASELWGEFARLNFPESSVAVNEVGPLLELLERNGGVR